MCSYCHEFIKRNKPVCGYCGKVFPKKEEPITIGNPDSWPNKSRLPAKAILVALAALLLWAGTILIDEFRRPVLLETVEISEPANIELVEYIKPTPSWLH